MFTKFTGSTGLTSSNCCCALCQEGINLGGRSIYPQYSLVNEHLYLGEKDFICAECLDKLQLIWLVPRNISLSSQDIVNFINSIINQSTQEAGRLHLKKESAVTDISTDVEVKPPIDQVIYAAPYQDYVKELIIQFKYQGKRELAGPLGKLMAASLLRFCESFSGVKRRKVIDYIKNLYSPIPYTAVVPVPVNHERLVERGYNQAELLAREVSQVLSIPLWQPAERVKSTSPLKWQSPEDRAQELGGAFQLKENYQSDFKWGQEIVDVNRILLVDDIYTTGATAMELAQVLQGAGCQYITVLTTAH